MNPQNDSDLENALVQISPSIPNALRDRMLYAAGQQAAHVKHRRTICWQLGVTGAVSGLLTFAITWMSQPRLQTTVNDFLVTNSSPMSTESSESSPDHLVKRQSLPNSESEILMTARFFTLNEVYQSSLVSAELTQPVSQQNTLTPRSSLDL